MRIKLPVKPMYIPPELSVDSNGCISTALLQEIGPECFLYQRAAAAWEKLCTAARHDGFELKPINSRSCYRTVKEQEDVFLTRYEKVDTVIPPQKRCVQK